MNFFTYLIFMSIPIGQIAFFKHLYLIEIVVIFVLVCLPILPRNKESNNEFLALDVVVFLFALSSLISVAVGANSFYESARFYRQMVLSPVLLYMLLRLMPVSMTTIVKAFYFMLLTIAIQALFYFHFYLLNGTRPDRGTGIIVSPITSGFFFCLGFFVLFYCRKLISFRLFRLILTPYSVLLVIALIISSTRAAVFGGIIALFCAKFFWQTRKRKKVYYLLFMGFLFLFLCLVSFYSFGHHNVYLDREKEKNIQHSTERLISLETYIKDIDARLSFWSYMAKRVIYNRPFLGFGSSGYTIGKIKGVGFRLGSVHNFLISSLITSGLLGLVLIMLLVQQTFSCFVNIDENSEQMLAVSMVLQASFTVLILIALTNDLTGGRVNIFFFLMALSAKLFQFRKCAKDFLD